MHGKSRVSSAISVYDNEHNFKTGPSIVAVAEWVGRWSTGYRVAQAEGLSPCGDIYQYSFLSAMIFISVLSCMPNGFNDIVILCGRPNIFCQQNLKCFDMSLLLSGLFS